MTQPWRKGLVPALVVGALGGVAGLLTSPAHGVTLAEHDLIALGGAAFLFAIIMLAYRFRIIRPAVRKSVPVNRGLLLALAGALIALAMYASR